MKRKIAVLLLFAMAVALIFNACGTKHVFNEWVEELPATCEKTGVKGHYHCTHCGKYFTEDRVEISDEDLIIPATGHTEVDDAAVAPTCAAAGKTAGKHCAVCGKVLVAQSDVPATGEHNFGEWIPEVPATRTASGEKGHYHCNGCGKNFDAEKNEIADLTIPPIDHDYGELIAEVPATCVQDGTKAHYVCTCCGKIFDEHFAEITEADLIIPATGEHNFGEWIPEVPATKTESGVKGHYHCDGCDKNFDAEYNELESLYIPAEQDAGWSIVV